jgi:CTP synthase (UTP-ammonia lyase)
VDPSYRHKLEQGGLTVSGTGEGGEIRIIELPDHPFFLATLFLPQTRSEAASPHPIIAGYADAVRDRLDE